MRAKIPQTKNEGRCGFCEEPRREICKHIVPARNFPSFSSKRTFEVRPENLDCRSKIVVYFVKLVTRNVLQVKRNLVKVLIIKAVRILTPKKT